MFYPSSQGWWLWNINLGHKSSDFSLNAFFTINFIFPTYEAIVP